MDLSKNISPIIKLLPSKKCILYSFNKQTIKFLIYPSFIISMPWLNTVYEKLKFLLYMIQSTYNNLL